MAFTFLPWSIKIIFGLISDTIPLFGSRRKSYLFIMAALQFVCMIFLGFSSLEEGGQLTVNVFTWMLFCTNLSIAFSDVIVDSLMCIQARAYPKDGSEELTSFSWTCQSIGGLLGSVTAAIITEYYPPQYCFVIVSVMAFGILAVAMNLSVELEQDSQSSEDGK